MIATLVSPQPVLNHVLLARAFDALKHDGAEIADTLDLEHHHAVDIGFSGPTLASARAALLEAMADAPVDVFVQATGQRRKKLLIADMDSTMITIECIDELADYVGKKNQVAHITEAAMRGDLDFVAALDARVALLAGLHEDILQQCYETRVRYTAGARQLVQTMAARGCHTVLVSGGFSFFTRRVAAHLGFAVEHANTLDVENDCLTGKVTRPIITAEVKRQTLINEAHSHHIALQDCLAVGDGANDIPMLETAGLGVAFHAKPKTLAAADAGIMHGDLTALLYAQGYVQSDWAQSD